MREDMLFSQNSGVSPIFISPLQSRLHFPVFTQWPLDPAMPVFGGFLDPLPFGSSVPQKQRLVEDLAKLCPKLKVGPDLLDRGCKGQSG